MPRVYLGKSSYSKGVGGRPKRTVGRQQQLQAAAQGSNATETPDHGRRSRARSGSEAGNTQPKKRRRRGRPRKATHDTQKKLSRATSSRLPKSKAFWDQVQPLPTHKESSAAKRARSKRASLRRQKREAAARREASDDESETENENTDASGSADQEDAMDAPSAGAESDSLPSDILERPSQTGSHRSGSSREPDADQKEFSDFDAFFETCENKYSSDSNALDHVFSVQLGQALHETGRKLLNVDQSMTLRHLDELKTVMGKTNEAIVSVMQGVAKYRSSGVCDEHERIRRMRTEAHYAAAWKLGNVVDVFHDGKWRMGGVSEIALSRPHQLFEPDTAAILTVSFPARGPRGGVSWTNMKIKALYVHEPRKTTRYARLTPRNSSGKEDVGGAATSSAHSSNGDIEGFGYVQMVRAPDASLRDILPLDLQSDA